jgi:hypothetical protein
LRILITNNTLAHRAGTELWVRDVSLRLLERGHSPIAYSRRLGEVAAELRGSTVTVVDDLDRLGEPPDIIHGHHHLEAMTAMLRFPNVPAVGFCHGWLPQQEAPVVFPTLRRYVAVDQPTWDRLVLECGIAPEAVEILPNFVDLRRFPPRGPLPGRPRRALVFSNQAREDNFLPAVRTACREAGLGLDAFGIQLGRPLASPGEVLGDYDVVFAKGRAALEAAAVGTAVVVCDEAGLGPMVTLDRLDWLRRLNFGVRTLREPVTPAGVARELSRYDPEQAAAVSRRLRTDADLDAAVDRLLALYADAIAEQRALPPPDADAVGRAAATYLRHGPLTGGDLWQHEREALQGEIARTRAELEAGRLATDRLGGQLEAERQACNRLRQELGAATDDLERTRSAAAADRARAESLAADLGWITGTLTWRLRRRALGWRWLARSYRRLRAPAHARRSS